jgi:hypothetical protein
MLDELTRTCEGSDCDRTLSEDDCAIVYRIPAGERRAYECTCGAVTVTVGR